jgi:hypothetical protein
MVVALTLRKPFVTVDGFACRDFILLRRSPGGVFIFVLRVVIPLFVETLLARGFSGHDIPQRMVAGFASSPEPALLLAACSHTLKWSQQTTAKVSRTLRVYTKPVHQTVQKHPQIG